MQPSIVQEIGEFLQIFCRWRGDRIGVLIVEQNVELIQAVAGRAYVMDKGRIVASLDKATIADTEALSRFLSI